MVRKIFLVISIILLVLPIIYARSIDINKDNLVNALDVGILNNNLGSKDRTYDINNDGIVNELDIGFINSIIINCPDLECSCENIECDPDSDNDGIFNDKDKCDNTLVNEISSVIRDISSPYYGCSTCEIDRDLDTVKDCNDNCPNEYGEGVDGCPSELKVLGEDLIIPVGETVYSNQIKNIYNNIYIYGQLDIIPYTGFSLSALNEFILYGVINANGSKGMPGKELALSSKYFEVEGVPIDINDGLTCGAGQIKDTQPAIPIKEYNLGKYKVNFFVLETGVNEPSEAPSTNNMVYCIDNCGIKDVLSEGESRTYPLTKDYGDVNLKVTYNKFNSQNFNVEFTLTDVATNTIVQDTQPAIPIKEYNLGKYKVNFFVLETGVNEPSEAPSTNNMVYCIDNCGIKDVLSEGESRTYPLTKDYGDVNLKVTYNKFNSQNFNVEFTLESVEKTDSNQQCTYSGPYTELINKHIQRYSDDVGITIQCSQSQILTRACGYCGNRIKQCADLGIWTDSWTDCQGQGYCNPDEQIPDILLNDTHRTSNCQNNKVEYAKTWEEKECGNACSYTNVKKVEESVSWQCNIGYCTATCSSSTNEACGRCGTLTCTNCKETCSGEGVCTPGTKRVNTECSGGCEIREDVCNSNCGWIVGTCSVPNTVDESCNEDKEIGTTRLYGYCGTQICKKRCDYSAEKGRAIYYWEDYKPEYTRNDKCLPGSIIANKVIKEKEPVCEGNLVKYQDTLESRACNNCRITPTGITNVRETPGTIKTIVKGQCGYQCNNGERSYSGSETGECQMGISECQNNQWVAIQNEIGPTSEVCNDGLDNDCDGETDEDCANVVKYEKPLYECNYNGKVTNFKSYYDLYKTGVYHNEIDFNDNYMIDAGDSICLSKVVQYSCSKSACADTNKDYQIDILDIARMSNREGLCIGDKNYDPIYDYDGDGCIILMQDSPDLKCLFAQDKDWDGYVAQGFNCGADYKYDCNDNDAKISECQPAKKVNNIACTSNNECQSGNCIKASLAPGYQPYCCPAADNCVQANGECVPPGTESTTTQHICMPGWLWKCEADPPGTTIPNWCGARTAGLSLAGCHATAPANSKVNECMYGGSYIGKSCLINGKPTADNCFVCNEGYTWDGKECVSLKRFTYNGYKWYAGDYGESCTAVCASHGGVNPDPTWNDDSSCTVLATLLNGCPSGCNGDYADGRVPQKQDDGWCFYRKDAAHGGVNIMPGIAPKEGPGNQIARRVCACNN